MHPFPLTKTNRLKLAAAFRTCPRVDFSIDCAVEGKLGKAFVDDSAQPAAFALNLGPFWYYAGETSSPGGRALIENLPAYAFLMPSTTGWVELAQVIFGPGLQPFTRYSFDAASLSAAHLEMLLQCSPFRENLVPLTVELVIALANRPEGYFDITDFDSHEDFLERSFGFAALDQGAIQGVAYASLVCIRGIEVSLYVEAAHRCKGVATALASRLLLESLRRGLHPNWDAANPESYKLAQKLGYVFTGPYDAYFHS